MPIIRLETDGIAVSSGEAPSGRIRRRRPAQNDAKGVRKLLNATREAGRPMGLKSELGGSAVEMALVLPMLVLILGGILDFGLVFNELMALKQGVGAGVRQGVVAQVGSSSSCPITGAAGVNAETKKLMCLTKAMVGLDTDVRTKIAFPGSKLKGGSLIVCAQTPLDSATTIFDPILNGALKSKVHMRIEQDLSALASSSETALAGSDWSWCV